MVDKTSADDSGLDRVFHALADTTRRSMLHRLSAGGVMFKELAEPLEISKQAASKHVHVLEDAGLVMRIAEGRNTRVQLRSETLRKVENWVEFYRSFWSDSLAALAEIVDGEDEEKSK